MTDQRLPVLGDDGDADERAFRAMSTFKDKVRDLVKETGLSGNALGKKIGLPDGKVSLWSTPSRNQPNLPPLDFVEALLREAQERGNVQADAANAFVREYGELLALYCARKKPHSVHVAMLAEYKSTMVIREMTVAMNEVRRQESGFRAEMETLREDRDGERLRRQDLQSRLDGLSQEYSRLASERQAAVECRDRAQTDLAESRTAKAPVVARQSPGLGTQGQTGPEQASSHANHLAVPPEAEEEADPALVMAWMVRRAIARVAPGVVLCLAGYGAFALSGGNKDDAKAGQPGNQTTATSSTRTPQSQAPSPTPPATPSPSPSASPADSRSGRYVSRIAWSDNGGSTVVRVYADYTDTDHGRGSATGHGYDIGQDIVVLCQVAGRAVSLGAYRGPAERNGLWYRMSTGEYIPGIYVDTGRDSLPAC